MSSVGEKPALRAAVHSASPEMLFFKDWLMFTQVKLFDPWHCCSFVITLRDISASLNCLSPQFEFLLFHLLSHSPQMVLLYCWCWIRTLCSRDILQSTVSLHLQKFLVFPFLPTTSVLNFYFYSINNSITDFKYVILHSTVTNSPFIAFTE